MRRYLCLYFPRWSIQCVRQEDPQSISRPTAVFQRSKHGPVLIQCSSEAQRLGVRRGMSVADARAMTPELILKEADVSAYRQALEALCLWAGRFSPLAGVEQGDPNFEFSQALWLDITGCEDVFRGEQNLLRQAVESSQRKGLKVRAAIAPTLGAAWALAHYGKSHVIVPDGQDLRRSVEALPLASLRLGAQMVSDLSPLGLCRIGDLLQQPRSTIPSRFGSLLLERLDQTLGNAPEILPLIRPAPEFRVARAFEYPVRNSEQVFKIVERLAGKLADELRRANRGARQLECWLYHEMASPACADVSLFRSSADGKHLWKLLHTRLEDVFRVQRPREARKNGRTVERWVDAEEGVCAISLHVTSSEPLKTETLALFESTEKSESGGNLCGLLDRLVTRLGPSAVWRVETVDDALPEHAFRLAALETQSASLHAPATPALRPLKILPDPVPITLNWPDDAPAPAAFEQRGKRTAIAHASGPERIESGWWRGQLARRDYYVIEAASGARVWIFKRLDDGRWFLHGMFE